MATTRFLSIHDLEQSPPAGEWELIDGEIVELTPASGRSSRIRGRINASFLRHGEEPGLGWAFPAETEFILFSDRQIPVVGIFA